MNHFSVEIRIKPRRGLLDPEGKAIHRALVSLGWDGVSDVRAGKAIHIGIAAESAAAATGAADAMCRKILANPVTEDYEILVEEVSAAGAGEGGA